MSLGLRLLQGGRRAWRDPRIRSDWPLRLRAGAGLLGILVQLRAGRFIRLLQVPSPTGCLDQAAVQRLADCVDGWLCLLQPSRPCLPRSLYLYRALRQAGWLVLLNLGVRALGGAQPFEGHAWLSLDGAPFLEPRPERIADYLPVFSSARQCADGADSPSRGLAGWRGR